MFKKEGKGQQAEMWRVRKGTLGQRVRKESGIKSCRILQVMLIKLGFMLSMMRSCWSILSCWVRWSERESTFYSHIFCKHVVLFDIEDSGCLSSEFFSGGSYMCLSLHHLFFPFLLQSEKGMEEVKFWPWQLTELRKAYHTDLIQRFYIFDFSLLEIKSGSTVSDWSVWLLLENL